MTGGHLAWYPTCFSPKGTSVRLSTRMSGRTAACIALVVSLSGAPALAGQSSAAVPPPAATPAPPPPPVQTTGATQSDEPVRLPVDLTRMKSALDRTPTMKLDDAQIRFYLEIVARQPSFKDFIGSYDFINGPVRNSQMTHQEFLDMVTPKLLHSSAGFTATETLQVALVNWAAQSVIKKAYNAIKNARNEDEVRAIRAQIDRELTALRGGGG